MKDITIIMPFLNEGQEVQKTVESIYETADSRKFHIVAIDDCSDVETTIKERKEITHIRNKKRMGVDVCRQMGADIASTPFLFIVDAHMRFSKGWFSMISDNMASEPNTLWCTTCVGLGHGNMDIRKARGKYRGANLVLYNKKNEIIESKWRKRHKEGTYDIACVLGANYGVSKEWFRYIHGLKGLRMWGSSEEFMSLKTWMAGGKCKIDTNINIGHKFRDNAPYATGVWNLIYNKIFMCKTILPEDICNILIEKIPKNSTFKRAIKEIEANKDFIKEERDYYQTIFKKPFNWFCEKWEIEMPVF